MEWTFQDFKVDFRKGKVEEKESVTAAIKRAEEWFYD